ncbi:MAG: hypothetical protein K6U88_12980 [Dehalococcoidia bacterium]|nr:hypothetical protein [Dehalococcoidia bacterium]
MYDRITGLDLPEEARAATGYAVGGTPPIGHPTRLRTWIDRDLVAFDRVWAAAGAPDAVFPVDPRELLRLGAVEADLRTEDGAGR